MGQVRDRGQCIAKMPHKCTDDHTTQEGLAVFEQEDGSITGFCFSCDKFIEDPLGGGKAPKAKPKKTPEEIAEQMEEIGKLPCIDLKVRKLRKGALEHYGIKVGLSERDGKTPDFVYQPYTKGGEVVGYKVKHLSTKNTWSVGNQRDVELFGWQQALESGAKRLIICEGELDAVAMHRILKMYTKDSFMDYVPAVVSLPHGAGSAEKDIKRVLKDLKANFTHISLCFDGDEAGEKATVAVSRLLPDATAITLPAKDANECLIKGLGKQAHKCVTFDTKEVKKSRLIFCEDIHEAAREPAKWGELSWGFPKLDQTTRGIRYGETIYIGAGVKLGKSEMVNALAAHFIKEHGIKLMMAKPEEANSKTHKLLCGKIAGKIFHDPKVDFDFDAYDKAGEVLRGHVAMLDLYQTLGWEGLKEDILESIRWGAKAIFIDPITNLTVGMPSSEANEKLQAIAVELSVIAKDHGVTVFIFCHLKSPTTGPDHQSGGRVLSSQFSGSRGMMRSCDLMLGLQGDKSPELSAEERNVRELVLLEDRAFGMCGVFPLQWDAGTGLFTEID